METSGPETGILTRRHWVFDLDGTLTLPVHDFAAIRNALAVPDGADILGHLGSLPRKEAWRHYERLDAMERELVDRTDAAPGAVELVELLAGRGCRLGIVTRNSREIALLTLAHIGLAAYFHEQEIIGRDEAIPKPDPEGIRLLARRWGTAPQQLVMVGDYLYDLQAGQAAGAGTIHVHGDLERRWPEWTDLCVGSLAELSARVRTPALPAA